MDNSKVNLPKLIGVAVIYILLSVIGLFSQIEMILFPILALPFAWYIAKHEPPLSIHIIFHGVMLVSNYLFTQSVASVLIYGAAVIVPVYTINFFYKQELPLPNFIMYVGIILAVSAFVFLTIFKHMGVDFEAVYMNILDEMKHLMGQIFDTMHQVEQQSGTLTTEMAEAITVRKQFMLQTLEMMKSFYAYFIVSQIFIISAITVIIYNAILRRKNKMLPSIKQLIEFRLSKMAVLLFIISLVLTDFSGSGNGVAAVLGLNLMNFLVGLFSIAGALGLIGVIKRSSIQGGLRVLGYIAVVLVFGTCPQLLVIFGSLDAIFNYSKVEIVV